MRKYLFLVLFLCASCIVQAYQLNAAFDSLFPMTWYQKGLEASLSVWQKLIQSFEKNDNAKVIDDSLLGNLAYAQFCVNRMQQENVVSLDEDKDYFVMVLHKIKELVGMIIVTQENEDFVLCAQGMVLDIQKQL